MVHVYQKWRNIVFRSSRYLKLLLYCKAKTSVMLSNLWPPLPIVMRVDRPEAWCVGNIMTVLKNNDRIHDLELELELLSSSQWE